MRDGARRRLSAAGAAIATRPSVASRLAAWTFVAMACACGDGVVAIRNVVDDASVDPAMPDWPVPPVVEVRGDTAVITFLPIAGARDYRIYEAPDPSRVTEAADGSLTIEDAIYRCAGDRPLSTVTTQTEGEVLFYERDAAHAVLGHVYLAPGPGRAPVHALADPTRDEVYEALVFLNTRVHFYTADASERDALLAAGFRDDGIAFYVRADGAGTRLFRYDSEPQGWLQDRTFTLVMREDDPERAFRQGEGTMTPTFAVLDEPELDADGAPLTVPLYRILYPTAALHDELAAGDALRDRYLTQGNQPVTTLTWSGLTAPTELVIEALDRGCPFTSILGPVDRPAAGNAAPFVALETAQAASPTGEVFINAQHPPSGNPIPIRRTRVTVSPVAPPAMDFHLDLQARSLSPADFVEVERRTGVPGVRYRSGAFDLDFVSVEEGTDGIGVVLGELWLGFADWASGTAAKARLAPLAPGTVSASGFFHATMAATMPATGRRYAQLTLSTVPPPLDGHMDEGTSLVAMVAGAAPELMLQLCDHEGWDANAFCPGAPTLLRTVDDRFLPAPVMGEEVGFDRRNRLDVYLSTARAYAFVDGRPYGCVDVPPGAFAEGEPVYAHFGAVLFHSGVDESVVCGDCPHAYLRRFSQVQTVRHFDDLGFESGVAAPSWDHDRFPCSAGFE